MKKLNTIILAAVLAIVASSAVYADMKADKQSVDTACVQDAQTAHCGSEQAGSGLMGCLHKYKKANHGFEFSEGCAAAMAALHADRKNHGAAPEAAPAK